MWKVESMWVISSVISIPISASYSSMLYIGISSKGVRPQSSYMNFAWPVLRTYCPWCLLLLYDTPRRIGAKKIWWTSLRHSNIEKQNILHILLQVSQQPYQLASTAQYLYFLPSMTTTGSSTAASTSQLLKWQPMERNQQPPPLHGYLEYGSIHYVNLHNPHTPYVTHDGDVVAMNQIIDMAKSSGKPIFANFVQWPGWQGCQEGGRIFDDFIVKRAAEECFVPCVFNTWDRDDPKFNVPMKQWALGEMSHSWWGYLRIIDPSGRLVVSGTGQITSYGFLEQVKQVMRESLEDLGLEVPHYLEAD